MLILYRERDLDEAYRIDCRARTKGNEPWIKREDFRNIYEALLDTYFTNSVEKKLEKKCRSQGFPGMRLGDSAKQKCFWYFCFVFCL